MEISIYDLSDMQSFPLIHNLHNLREFCGYEIIHMLGNIYFKIWNQSYPEYHMFMEISEKGVSFIPGILPCGLSNVRFFIYYNVPRDNLWFTKWLWILSLQHLYWFLPWGSCIQHNENIWYVGAHIPRVAHKRILIRVHFDNTGIYS